MTSISQLSILQDAYREKLALYNRHIAGATRIADYEFNNAYQYIIARDEIHVQWLRDAVQDVGGPIPDDVQALAVPPGGKGPDAERGIMEDDARQAQAFCDRWRARLEAIRNARHRKLVELLLGEVMEQKRSFDQAVAGRDDLLGRRMAGASTGDGVLAVRWME